jgi:PTS system cellobiose-specific IIC component
MSISSDASKPSSASSNTFVARLRAFADLPAIKAIREALPYSFGGLIAALLVLLPLTRSLAGSLLPSLSVMAVTLVVVLAVRLARDCGYSPPAFALAALAAFALALPRPFVGPPLAYMKTLGGCGLFLAMVVCLIVAGAIALSRRIIARAAIADLAGASAAVALFGALFLLGWSPANAIAQALLPLGTLGDSYAGLIVVVLVETLLWVVGVHGPAVLAAVVTPLYLTLQTQNADAYQHHRALPHIVTVSLFLFVFPGGAGGTLPLSILLAFSRVPRLRTVGRVSVVPALFNTNEPLMFGAPVVFNPLLAVPFVIAPLMLATTTYAAVAHGLVGRAIYYVPSFVPTLASTYLATLDWRAVALTLVNVAIAGAIYFPFVRAYERHLANEPATIVVAEPA